MHRLLVSTLWSLVCSSGCFCLGSSTIAGGSSSSYACLGALKIAQSFSKIFVCSFLIAHLSLLLKFAGNRPPSDNSVEAAMLMEVQKVNRAYRDLQGLLISQIQKEYAKSPAARAKRQA